MELWDAYDRNGKKIAGIELIRGEEIPDGMYHMVCETICRHKNGQYLVMTRDTNKNVYPGMYECTGGGSAIKGEDALTAAKRELFEETGIHGENFRQVQQRFNDQKKSMYVNFVCETDIAPDSVVLQEGETIAYEWVTKEKLTEYIDGENFIPPHIEIIKKVINELS